MSKEMHETGPEPPAMVPYTEPAMLPSERVILAAPFSLAGSAERICRQP
jgi:hypothetical protein